MTTTRRTLLTMAGLVPLCGISRSAVGRPLAYADNDGLVLSDFTREEPFIMDGTSWRGFTDRVMGGVSSADFGASVISGRRCARMAGTVTRDNGGGFIQMAMYLRNFTASDYAGIELLVFGNDEDYNLHVRTADCGWHDESYRATFRAGSRWQTIRVPWAELEPNRVAASLDTSRLQRIGLLGWMRDFDADLALGAISLYG
jgi:hypothetical protein